MSWNRAHRIEALLQEKIARLVLERLNDPRLGFVTITGVTLSGDRHLATVKYTVLGTPGQRRTSERALNDAAPHVRELLGPSMRMRVLPELRFRYDESIERESRMLDLLGELEAERPPEPAAEAAEDAEGAEVTGAAESGQGGDGDESEEGEEGDESGAARDTDGRDTEDRGPAGTGSESAPSRP